ncbi:hypothetical protein CDAR_430961 [Caerostris darwini]|uniref:Solute carrier family 13 member 5 n=1 Tax=Caerostris darwini TaxID=1538125 RepID=A0AAV4U152_9ARAC|nr:hypothetical protein CDAR_430961 [Caerostris darwini]
MKFCYSIHLFKYSSLTESKQVNNIEKEEKRTNSNKKQDDPKTEEVRLVLLLSVCYAANIGGLGTLIGTGPNLVFKGMLAELHPASTEVTFTTWMMYNTPGMVLCVLIAWFYLWMLYVRGQKIRVNNESKEKIFAIISERYDTLGSITPHETSVLVLFSILVCLLVFRDPKFMPGWEALIGLPKKIGDSAPAMAVAFLLFFLPSNLRDLNSPPILKWKSVQAKLPWGIIILFGGGFGLAHGAKESGFSDLLSVKLSSLSILPPGVLVAIICFTISILTEIISNTTLATIMLPVLNQMALSIGVNPLLLMLTCTISCSFSFMLPVATPPNAIIYENSNMKTMDMVFAAKPCQKLQIDPKIQQQFSYEVFPRSH